MRIEQLEKLIASMLAPLSRGIRMVATKVTITGVNDQRKIQTVKLSGLEDERLGDVQHLQPFGFTAHPPVGANGLMICVAGSRTHPVVIVADDGATRVVNLQPGESCVYNAQGDFAHFKNNRELHVKAALKVTAETPLVHCTADVEIGGNLLVHGDTLMEGNQTITQNLLVEGTAGVTGTLASATSVSDPLGTMGEIRSVFNTHTHSGVDTGVGSSGAPNETMA